MHTSRHVSLTSFGYLLVLHLAIALFTILSAAAQNPPPEPAVPNAPAAVAGSSESTAERVIVTGSNIPTAEEVGPNPVLDYNRDVILKSGDRTTEEFLRNLPVANATGVPVSNN